MNDSHFTLPLLHTLLGELKAIRELLLDIVTERESGDYGRLYSEGGGPVDYSRTSLIFVQLELRERVQRVSKEHKAYIVALVSEKEYAEWKSWIMQAARETLIIDPADPDQDHPVGSELKRALYLTDSWIRRIQQPDPQLVFVVYGRNRKARDAMVEFLRAIKLKPVGWDEAVTLAGGGSPFIGEVLEAGFTAARAVIVILTGDDWAQLRRKLVRRDDPDYERKLTPQARPNVLFEAGFAFARYPKRTILVEFGRLRPFSDVQGRYVIRMDNTLEKRQVLAERLRNAGCAVSLSGNDWQSAGAFDRLK